MRITLIPGSPPLAGNLGSFGEIYLPWSPIPDASHTATNLLTTKSLAERIFPPLAFNGVLGALRLRFMALFFLQVTSIAY
jgi:hypothetical protein